MPSHPVSPEQLAALPPEVRAVIDAIIDHYERKVAKLEAENKALREELGRAGKTPANSSLPPSSVHPHAKLPKARRKSKRKRGGQPGHPKAERDLIPSEECTEVVTLRPKRCRRCGTGLSGSDASPLRHQVWELPVIEPLVTEYQRHRLECPCCGESTCAPLPPGVPVGQSGPRLVAFVAMLMAYFRHSKRRTAEFVSSVMNIPCSPALSVKHQSLATESTRAAYEELATALSAEQTLFGDESPTKEGTTKAWLWTFVARAFTVFVVRPNRTATVLTDLFGESYAGVMHCDRAKMYWQLGRLQWCWAHLKRDFQALADDANHQVKRLGHDLLRPTQELFRCWSRCRDGTITIRGFKKSIAPIRRRVEALLLRGVFSGNPRLVGMCEELYEHREWLWKFVDTDGVEPTNNAAERALRPAVIWRKLSFGTQSAKGSRFVETLLTVITTCRQQGRDPLAYLAEAINARFHGKPAPSLLPGV